MINEPGFVLEASTPAERIQLLLVLRSRILLNPNTYFYISWIRISKKMRIQTLEQVYK